MFPISSGFPLPWTTNPQRLNFFSLFSLASSSSWKKTPKARSTLAIPEWKHCTANKTNNHPRMSILHHAKHDTGFCRQSAVFMSPVPQLSIAQQGLLRPFGCAPSLQPSSPWTFFFSLFLSLFFACQSSISCWVQPFVIHGSSLGHSWAFHLPQVSSSRGCPVLQPTASIESSCHQVQDSISKCSKGCQSSPWSTLWGFHGASCSAVFRPDVWQIE